MHFTPAYLFLQQIFLSLQFANNTQKSITNCYASANSILRQHKKKPRHKRKKAYSSIKHKQRSFILHVSVYNPVVNAN